MFEFNVFFEFENEKEAEKALHVVRTHMRTTEGRLGLYRTVHDARNNCNPAVLQITFGPHLGDMRRVAETLVPRLITEDYQVIWPKREDRQAA